MADHGDHEGPDDNCPLCDEDAPHPRLLIDVLDGWPWEDEDGVGRA